jgi:hypothetical protein
MAAGPDAGAVILETDGRGALGSPPATISLSELGSGWVWVPVAEGMGEGTHSVRLTSAGEGRVAVDGFRVANGAARDMRRFLPHVLSLMGAGLLITLASDVRRAGRRIRL